MVATIKEEQRLAEQNSELGMRAVFQGRNSLRLLICAWPKITQQFLGLTVFNTFATYFCKCPIHHISRKPCYESLLTRLLRA